MERERKKRIKEEKRLEREQKKKVREEKRLLEEQKKKCAVKPVKRGRKTRSRTQGRAIDDVLASLHLSSSSASDEDGDSPGDSEDDTTCPKCGIKYVDSPEPWICCDSCDSWFKISCTNIKRRVPEVYYCETCAF